MEWKRILAAIDFSDVTGAVISTAGRLAKRLDARMCILHTESPPAAALGYGVDPNLMTAGWGANIEAAVERQVREDEKALSVLQEQLAGGGLEVETRLAEGSAVETILKAVAEFEADLVVVGSHSHGAFYHLVVGSVREALVAKAQTPVLVVPEGFARAEIARGEAKQAE